MQPIQPMRRLPQGRVLYESVFEKNSTETILDIIASGIQACYHNARHLFADARLLWEKKSFCTAVFLSATTDEEIAKVYILLDMARLDFVKHESTIRKLCKNFYNHIAKWIYIEVITRRPLVRNMAHLKEVVEPLKDEYIPGDYESGEPGMPHEAIQMREWQLYVDYFSYDEQWNNPSSPSYLESALAVTWKMQLEDTKTSLEELEKAEKFGLFKKDSIKILHEEFSKKFVNTNTPTEEIFKTYDCIFGKLETIGIYLPSEMQSENALLKLPLYHYNLK